MTDLVSALPRGLVNSGLAFADYLAILVFGAALVNAKQPVAMWYGPDFDGATTAGGEPFNPSGLFVSRATPWS